MKQSSQFCYSSRLFFLLLFLVIRQSAFAQGAATGDLHVSVVDPKGSVVTNADVIARDDEKGLERSGSSDGLGGYNVRQLAPGNYTVTVDAPGFGKAEANAVVISVGSMAELPITLSVADSKKWWRLARKQTSWRLRAAQLPIRLDNDASITFQSTGATTSTSR